MRTEAMSTRQRNLRQPLETYNAVLRVRVRKHVVNTLQNRQRRCRPHVSATKHREFGYSIPKQLARGHVTSYPV